MLVSNATVCQKEIVIAGKSAKTSNVYRRDPTWARGLISAAHSVAGAVQVLVTNASDVAQGISYLISCSFIELTVIFR